MTWADVIALTIWVVCGATALALLVDALYGSDEHSGVYDQEDTDDSRY